MASFMDRVFRRYGKTPAVKPIEPVEPAPAIYRMPVIEAPTDYPAELSKAPQRYRPRPAHMQGKRRTPAENEADRNVYGKARRAQAAVRHAYEADRATKAGITHYRWMAARGASACPTCRERDGQVFAFDQPVGFAHPGMVECDDGDACRCLWRPVVEGFI